MKIQKAKRRNKKFMNQAEKKKKRHHKPIHFSTAAGMIRELLTVLRDPDNRQVLDNAVTKGA